MNKIQWNKFRFLNKSQLTKAVAIECGFRTAKEAKEFWDTLTALREVRAERKMAVSTNSKVMEHFDRIGRGIIRDMGVYPSFDSFHIHYGGSEFSISYSSYNDWDKYAKSCRYPAKIHEYSIHFPVGGVRILNDDGMTFVAKGKPIQYGEVVAMRGWLVKKGRGCEVSTVPMWLVRCGDISAHGETKSKAMQDLQKKANILKRKSKFLTGSALTLDTKISAADYQRLTGACTAGTNAWLEEHGFNRRQKMSVRELLAILTPYDFGRRQLVNILKENGCEV